MSGHLKNYQLKKKLEFSERNKIHFEPEFVYFDLDKQPYSIGDILGKYQLWYIREKEILDNIIAFLGLSNTLSLVHKIKRIWLYQRLVFNNERGNGNSDRIISLIPEVIVKDVKEEEFERQLVKQICSVLDINLNISCQFEKPQEYFKHQINNINSVENAQLYDNLYIKETESKIYILTKIKPFILMFQDLDESSIVVDYMRYNTLCRKKSNKYKKVHCEKIENALVAQISVGKNTCKLFSHNYLTVLHFSTEWSRTEQTLIIDQLLSKFKIVAITQRDIRLELIPSNNINISYFFILLDIITSGKHCEHFITHEQENVFTTHKPNGDLETKKYSFYLDEKKFNFVRPVLNVLIKTDNLSSTVEVDYISKMISELLNEFNVNKQNIIDDYNKRVINATIQEIKKEKKTKQNVDILRDAEPKVFKNTSYTQKCQKSRQPFIIDNVEMLTSHLEASLQDPYWEKELDLKTGEVATIEKILEKYQVNDVKDLTLEFPTIRLINEEPELYGLITPKIYTCLPRKEKNRTHVFPGILGSTIKNSDGQEIKVPCCFKRKKDIEPVDAVKRGDNYPLGPTRDLKEGRQGLIPQYLGSILSNKYLRKGAKKPNFLSILDEVCKNERREFEATFNNSWEKILQEREFFIGDETKKYVEQLLIQADDRDFIENVNFLGFILRKNIVLFDTINIYNSILIIPRLLTTTIFPSFDSFVGIRINSIGELESINTINSAYIHEGDSEFSKYIKFCYEELQRETIKI